MAKAMISDLEEGDQDVKDDMDTSVNDLSMK